MVASSEVGRILDEMDGFNEKTGTGKINRNPQEYRGFLFIP